MPTRLSIDRRPTLEGGGGSDSSARARRLNLEASRTTEQDLARRPKPRTSLVSRAVKGYRSLTGGR